MDTDVTADDPYGEILEWKIRYLNLLNAVEESRANVFVEPQCLDFGIPRSTGCDLLNLIETLTEVLEANTISWRRRLWKRLRGLYSRQEMRHGAIEPPITSESLAFLRRLVLEENFSSLFYRGLHCDLPETANAVAHAANQALSEKRRVLL